MSDAAELAEVPQLLECWLAGRALADRSRRDYARNVRAYCAWLAQTPDRTAAPPQPDGCDNQAARPATGAPPPRHKQSNRTGTLPLNPHDRTRGFSWI
jgi:hypothetical protein